MRVLKENHKGFSTILALALIPLSGFATDIYLPSLPAMANDLHVSAAAVQLSLVLFMFSVGVSQFFIGSILDSFGRYKIGLVSLALFSVTSFVIAVVPNIYVIYAMRIIQGITIALIVVGKRAYFVDLFKDEKLKSYISLFSIIWACAPIMAPFLGGYLQSSFGWRSNFYFLGGLSLVFLVLELIYSGESLKHYHPFRLKSIAETYKGMLKTPDFTLGLLIIGICFGIVVVFSLSSPFIIERVLGHSAITTGYTSLLSGLSLMTGGIIAKALIKKPLGKKVGIAFGIQILLVLLMIFTSSWLTNIYTLIGFIIGIHIAGGFIFNIIYGYCLTRFSKNAGVASGLTGGVMYMISSIFSYGFANLFKVKSQLLLGVADLSLLVIVTILFVIFNKYRLQNSLGNVVKE
ncbi:MFS transporter [Flavobacterium circumlabens]|uniref:MFS family arabinose efflux permease n=1 Tax=Flavobacterium circumlabens TaxID=2133765 RepID=A0A4Y7UFA4_9FLAO|nr:MFS transporter [Flavobacterium circumlabens]TCN59893.1 putative MFS family arabinose efflux permease [Flavobacterium circumlabens]TEB45145.1 MFS transporter [Flavobacterium circumlabens]